MRRSSYSKKKQTANANLPDSLPHDKHTSFKIGWRGIEWTSHWQPRWQDVVLVAIAIGGALAMLRGWGGGRDVDAHPGPPAAARAGEVGQLR